ncbi:unnamed protein product [Parascedosporium putredinis]|uniref:C3H1-type domain-containing protein n=1 Tax=Parascedosporium putredinis TaxID=1442378 RepID=A0A9P1MCR6_9PEZI|nr:unnamed protein product [Parascedosporium putredinis]CAI7998307.1 unnamed protein product [Parascedosporium putredinis]
MVAPTVAAQHPPTLEVEVIGDPVSSTGTNQQPTWVSKTDRHLQLINSSVYEKDSQTRAKAIAETIQQKRQRQDDREKVKLKQFLQAGSAGPTVATATVRSANEPGAFELDIEGIRFRVAKDGSKLVKLSAVVGGVKFFRSKTGNLYRDGIVKAHRQSGKVKKVDTPCKTFSTTGNSHSHSLRAPSRRILSQSLLWIQEMMRDVSPGAPVCRQFALFGYCDKASQCPERHVFECPDFSNTGKCKTKGCKLVHRERASVLRKVDQRDDDNQSTEDLSSDDDSVASDDVDSDEVEEFVGDDNVDQSAFKEQRDYISF